MECNIACSKFFAYLDGELGEEERAALEAHFCSCPDCQRLIDLERTFRARYLAPLRPDPVPESVRREVACLLETLSNREPREGWWRRRASLPLLGASAVAVMLVCGGGMLGVAVQRLWNGTNASLIRLAEASVEQHQKLVRGILPYDVEHMSPDAAEQWFRRRLDFNVNLPQLPRQNLTFVGGRIAHLSEVDVAALHYQLAGKDVSLFIMPEEEYGKLGLKTSPKFKVVTYQGYDVIAWASHGTAYTLVSEIGGRSCLVCHSPDEKLDLPTSLKTHGKL